MTPLPDEPGFYLIKYKWAEGDWRVAKRRGPEYEGDECEDPWMFAGRDITETYEEASAEVVEWRRIEVPE